MSEQNDYLAAMITQIISEQLKPVRDELREIRQLTHGLQGGIKRINVRLATVEALLDVDPGGVKH